MGLAQKPSLNVSEMRCPALHCTFHGFPLVLSSAVLAALKRIASILIAGSHNDEVCHTALALRLTAKLRRQLTESIVDEFADYALGSFPDPRSRFPNPVRSFSVTLPFRFNFHLQNRNTTFVKFKKNDVHSQVEGRPAEIKGFIEVKIFCLLLMVMALINEGQYERVRKCFHYVSSAIWFVSNCSS